MAELIRNAVVDAVIERRSIRSYTEKQISDSELETVLQAGLWAPSAKNAQEINFYVIQNQEIINKIANGYSKFTFNNEKARSFAYDAPTLILLYGKTDARYMAMDAGIAAENMSLVAHSLGLGSLIIGIIKEYMYSDEGRKFSASLKIPEDYSFGIAIALGHTDQPTPSRPRVDGRITYVK